MGIELHIQSHPLESRAAGPARPGQRAEGFNPARRGSAAMSPQLSARCRTA